MNPRAIARSPRVRLAGKALAWAVVIGLLAWILHGIWRGFEQMDLTTLRPRPVPLAFSGAALLIAHFIRAFLFWRLLGALGQAAPGVTAARVFFASQAARFIPGKVWQFAGVGAFGRACGLSASPCLMTGIVGTVIHTMAGAALGTLALSAVSDSAVLTGAVFALACAAAVLLLTTNLFTAVQRLIRRRIPGGMTLTAKPKRTALVLISLGHGVIWVLFGISLAFLVRGLLPDAEPMPWLLAISVTAASCVIGFVAIFAPSGLGVREAALVLLLTPTLGVAQAGVIALSLRVWMGVMEAPFLCWGSLTLIGRVGRQSPACPPADGDDENAPPGRAEPHV